MGRWGLRAALLLLGGALVCSRGAGRSPRPAAWRGQKAAAEERLVPKGSDEDGAFDTCRGDSGGPLMCYLPEYRRFFVMGITSFGHGCGRRHFPGIYSGPSYFQKWLTDHFSQGSTKGMFNMDMLLGQILMAFGSIILLETA